MKTKHWTTEEIDAALASAETVAITLDRGDSAPNYASTRTRVWGPGLVTYLRNASGGVTTQPGDGTRVL